MRARTTWLVKFGFAGCLAVRAAFAQDTTRAIQLVDRGPRFLSASGRTTVAADVSDAPVFSRRVTLELVQVPLAAALSAIARQSGVQFAFAPGGGTPVNRPVSVSATAITVRAALYEILLDTELDVQLTRTGLVMLVPRVGSGKGKAHAQPGGGALTGRVTDAVTRRPLDQVAVRVDGPGLGAASAADGHYTIHNVPPGTYHVVARRVGYTPLTKTVTLGADSAMAVDFALAAAPTKLNEVVTTAVGDQRRYEVGNTISTINADSIAPTAPITSLTDLISARAPGVEVLETSGMTGAGEAIRIRGISSLVLQNDPIVIVDGVRQQNSPGGDLASVFVYQGNHPTPTRLNDIDFSDIESIDVLKGPSASTEYGTDAASGVIVITTKHGTAGKSQWKVSAEQTESTIPVTFPDNYYSWGHSTDGSHTPVQCPLVSLYGGPASTMGTCAVDSVTRWSPLNHPYYSVFGTGNRGKYDVSVSGGSDAIRYFMSGGLTNERGLTRLPPVFRQLVDTAKLGLPSSAFNPNSEQQRSARINTAVRLGPLTDLSASAAYLSTYQQTPEAGELYRGAYQGLAINDAAHYYGYGFYNGVSPFLTPPAVMRELGSQATDRVTGGVTANWRPSGWFVGHATVGLDHGSQQNEVLNYPPTNPAYENYGSFLGLARATTDVYTLDVRGTATVSPAPAARLMTSAGLQVVDTRTAGQSASTSNITTTNVTLNGAPGITASQQGNRQATFGGYGEEELSIADQLFLTGALRVDAGSNFGRAYTAVAYPKASVSWLAINRGATTVRVRGAFGESGIQPTNGAALALYGPTASYLGGGVTNGLGLIWPGNPTLRPERSEEFEGGIDVTGWANRISVEVTGYSKTTRDALVNLSLGGDVCCFTYQENIGKVRNSGVELSAAVGIVQHRWATVDLGLDASIGHNTLLALAPGALQQPAGSFTYERQVPGYSLYGIWEPQMRYRDANGDGIIEPNEVTLINDSAIYRGPTFPTQQASITTHVGLWHGTVTVSGLVDYRGGYRIVNTVPYYASGSGGLREQNDPHAPLWLQARAVAMTTYEIYSEFWQPAENGSFVRFRELSATWTLPRAVVRRVRAQSLSVTGAVRNLALWTHYTGVDPEVNNTGGTNVQATPTSASGVAVDNNIRQDFGGVPLARYWVLRLNLGI